MPRSREFDATDALAKAMGVFWAKGYFGTSIEDLVEATGVSRYGLYSEFGDKNGLFLAALEHYQTQVARPLLDIVEQPEGGLEALRALFRKLADFAGSADGKLGCLVFNSVNEMSLHDAPTASKILDVRGRMEAGIRRLLNTAWERSELPEDFDVRREGDFLFAILHAVPTMARTGADPETLRNVIAVALATLDPERNAPDQPKRS